ncbi:MAG: hypothetical protein KAI47_13635, partial [Deltaproteobacteria bacterium]|nr:hypothetical protein [Deltaproteobacteria bacterium]
MGEETTSSIGEDASSSIWVEVAPLAAVSGLLTYRVKASLASLAQPGSRVLVPLGQQRGVLGVIARRDVGALAIAEDRIKDVTEILDETPALPPDVISLVLWAATYYCAPPGEMVRAALPALLLRQGAGQQRIGLTTAGAEAL